MPRPETCPDPLCILDMPDPSACEDCPNVPQPHNPAWGGKRPGAGAPRGNLNHLKHGRYSKLIERGVEKIAQDPDLLSFLYLITSLAENNSVPEGTRAVIQKVLARTRGV